MNIMNFTHRTASWQPGLPSGPRDQVFDAMLRTLCTQEFFSTNPELTHDSVLQALIVRETQRNTTVGRQVAFPHARLEKLQQALFAVATFAEPVRFEEFPVRIICLILVPAAEPSLSIKLMAQISRILMEPEAHRQVLEARNPDELRGIIMLRNPRIDSPLLARDVMRPPRYSALETDRVSKCSHIMSVSSLQAMPVVDDRRRILGEITVEGLFRYGLPDFFAKVQGASSIADFSSFEKYFEEERDTAVGAIMSKEARTVSLDCTIMEIVFDLTIRQYSALYVIDKEGHWVGTIDKSTVLDNVINH